MGRIKRKKRKTLFTLKKLRQTIKKLLMKETISKTVAMDINKPSVCAVEVIENDNRNSLPTDEHKSMNIFFSKVTVPDITIYKTIDIIDITSDDDNTILENFQTVDHKKTALNIDNCDIIDITDTTDITDISDITNITSTSNKYVDVSTQFSTDTILCDDDVQIIDQNNSTEIITIFDNSDEENISNQKSIKKCNNFKSIHKHLDISTTGTIRSSYNSPLHNHKRKREKENISRLDYLSDKQKMSTYTQSPKIVEQKPVKISKPHLSSTVSTSSINRKLRPVIIDGLNIGHAHGSGTFSGKGIELCIQFFTDLGHKEVIAFIPQHRQGPPGSESKTILNKLVKKGQICYTPSRKVKNTRMTCYDDRIILDYAYKCDGVVVSNDNYRDLYDEKEAFKEIIENRQVMVTFVRDQIIVPEDQYNRRSTVRSLSDILSFPI